METPIRYEFTAFSLCQVIAAALLAGACGGAILSGRPPLIFAGIALAMVLATGGVIWHARVRVAPEEGPDEATR